MKYLTLLVEFILNDAIDRDLFNYLIERIYLNRLDNRLHSIGNIRFIWKLILAKTCPTLFSNDLDKEIN